MILNAKHTMIFALALSGLVHGVVLVSQYSADIAGLDDSHVISGIELELLQPVHQGETHKSGKPTPVVVDAGDNIPAREVKDAKIKRTPKPEQKIVKSIEPVVADKEIAQTITQQEQQASIELEHSQKAEALSVYLYQAINQQKHYPYRAKRQNKQGVVKLSFVMHPTGDVTDVSVTHSSQYAILDKAATHAVEAISPFYLAGQYLNSKHQYSVDIDFRIN